MGSLARRAALVATISVVPALSAAQSAAPVAPVVSAAPASGDTETAAASPSASAKTVVPATGYSYGSPGTAHAERAHNHAAHGSAPGIDALMAGFETLADGSTRLYVELSKPVAYDAKAGRSSLTYVLKGTHVDRRNNQNPLVTVHFNTPVTSARLAPHGRDLWLVVDLRANVQPTATMDATKDGAALLRIDFPKGEYLPALAETEAAATPGPATPSSAQSAAPTPPASPAKAAN